MDQPPRKLPPGAAFFRMAPKLREQLISIENRLPDEFFQLSDPESDLDLEDSSSPSSDSPIQVQVDSVDLEPEIPVETSIVEAPIIIQPNEDSLETDSELDEAELKAFADEDNHYTMFSDDEDFDDDLIEDETLVSIQNPIAQDDDGTDQLDTPFAEYRRMMDETVNELEEEALRGRSWELMGESTAKERDENALLAMPVEFSYHERAAPVVDESFNDRLERIILKRISNMQFDDPVRISTETSERKQLPTLDDRDDSKRLSLAEQYAQDYRSLVDPDSVTSEQKIVYEEIAQLFRKFTNEVSQYSSFYVAPAAPDMIPAAVLATRKGVSLGESEEPGLAAEKRLAPHELARSTPGVIKGEEELTSDERTARRRRKKRSRKKKGLTKQPPAQSKKISTEVASERVNFSRTSEVFSLIDKVAQDASASR